jgi:pimeloyl-ACP methyl ester carboxylesterase
MIEDARGNVDYAEEGSGPTVVLVPGSWGARSAWRGVIAAVDGRFRFITTSLLGYGGTTERRSESDISIKHEADIIEAISAVRDTYFHAFESGDKEAARQVIDLHDGAMGASMRSPPVCATILSEPRPPTF